MTELLVVIPPPLAAVLVPMRRLGTQHRRAAPRGREKLFFARVPKVQLGNPDDEALASRDGKLELPAPNSQAGAWELALTKILNLMVVTRCVVMQYRRVVPREAVENPLVRQWVRGTGHGARERDVVAAGK
jgi:hypothetical protein